MANSERAFRDNSIPWIVGGDFNEILHEDEKKGGVSRPQGQMDSFKNAVNHYGLYHFHFTGYPFTWSNGREGDKNIQCRLDKFFGNIQCTQTWSRIKVSHLQSSYSDHLPILLSLRIDSFMIMSS